MEINNFAKLWQSDLTDSGELQKLWDLRADDFNNRSNQSEDSKRREKVIEFLVSRDMLPAHGEILDIGCGPGKYSLAFAAQAKRVVGIDISPKMIQYARENAAEENRDNTCFKLMAWESLCLEEQGWSKKFDLVFASMCPGINSSDALLKMCEASRGSCFMSSFVQRSDELRDELHRAIYGSAPEHRWGKNLYYTVNILWLSGYYPEITYHDAEFEHLWPVEKAVEIYSRQLKSKNCTDVNRENQIAEYLHKKAVVGMIREKVQAKIAWIGWKVS
ncbi:MAG TPA: class I SAM-dependent methyltransferase [Methylomusa anaerophila]|uniref:Mg-protoporphyrin IX methyl transferase n=1 Tax=Methylomusa anaerophila TaxID=1930071 RepID=A0A348AF08_9FIRM|nr:class I SAM-dependent methyltransferase [Methylomusa anaerophila]BBB89656.1 Mg-protoporphyrin IX methyl transferase [Methylomusa anaerophila]HML89568.1 class I SAM-dependent methyltransferase [Methylomusa anaerophila]